MKRLIIPCIMLLIFALLITRTTDSLGGASELPGEVQRILQEIKERQVSANASPEERSLSEKQGSQQPVEKKKEEDPTSSRITSGRLDEKNVVDAPSPSERSKVDPLFDAKIRYRNMVDKATKQEASGKGSQPPSLDSGDETAGETHEARQDLKSENTAKVKITTGIKPPLSTPDKVVQSPKAPFDMPQESCQELLAALDAISASLNAIQRDITSLRSTR